MNKLLGNEKFWMAILLLLVLPFIVLSFYAHPSADDYTLSFVIRERGIFPHMHQYFIEWSGRYFATVLECFNPLVFGWIGGYKIIPFVLIILFYLGAYRFLKSILKEKFTSIKIHLYSLVLLILYFNNLPSTSECIYWMSCSLEYFTGNIAMLFFFAVLIKIWYSEKIKVSSYFILVLLIMMCVGTNETSMFLLNEILIIIFLKEIILKRKLRRCLIVSIITALLVTAFEISAPGNFVRMGMFDNNADIVFTAWQSIISFSKIAVKFIQDPGFLISSMLFIAFIPSLRASSIFRGLTRVNPFIVMPISVVVLMSLYTPVIYATGLNPPLRVHNMVSFAFVFAFFYNVAVIYSYLLKKSKIVVIDVPSYLVKLLATAAIILTMTEFAKEPGKEIVCEGNVFHAYYDLFVNANNYNRELNNRENQIIEAVKMKKKFIDVQPLTSIPKTIHFIDITKKASYWTNASEANYFGIDSIRIANTDSIK